MLRPLLPIVAFVVALESAAHAADAGKHAEAVAAWDTVAKSGDAKEALAYAKRLGDMDDADRDLAAIEHAAGLAGSSGKDVVDTLGMLAAHQAWHGQYDAARATAAKALTAAGGDSAAKAHALSIAGDVELAAGVYATARSKYEAAAAAAGGNASEVARAAIGLGTVLDRLNDYAGAKSQLSRAAKADGDVGYEARVALADTLQHAGDYPGRLKVLGELVTFASQAGIDPVDAADAKVLHATALANSGQFAEAKKLFDAAITELDALVGADSPKAAKARVARGGANTSYGDYASASGDFRNGLAILRASRATHPDLPEALREYATFAQQATAHVDRIAALEEALAAAEATRGPSHPATAAVLVDLGRAFDAAGGSAHTYSAYVALVRARAIYVATAGEGHTGVARVDDLVAYLYYRWNLDDASYARFQALMPVIEAAYGKDNPALVDFLQRYATESGVQSGQAGTKKLRARALALATKQGESSVAAFRARYQLVYDASIYNQPAEAVSLGQALLADETKTLAPTSNDLGRARNTVSYNLDRVGKNDDAKAGFAAASTAWSGAGTLPRQELGTIYANAGNLATEMGDTASAVELYAKAVRAYERSTIRSPRPPTSPTRSSATPEPSAGKAMRRRRAGPTLGSSRSRAWRSVAPTSRSSTPPCAFAAALAVGSPTLAEPAATQAVAALSMGEWSEAGVASEIMFHAATLHLMGRADEARSLAGLALDLAAENVVRPPNSRGEITVTNLDFESAGCVRILGALILARQGDAARARSVLESVPAAFGGSPRKGSYASLQGGLAEGAAWLVLGDADRANKAIAAAATTYGNIKLNNPAELIAADAIVGTLLRRAGQVDQGNKAIDAALAECDNAARCGTPNVAWAFTLAAWERRAAKDPAALDLAQRAMDVWEQDTDVLVRGLQDHERRAVQRARAVSSDLLLDLEPKDHRTVLESTLRSESATREAEADDPVSLWQSSASAEVIAAADRVRDLRQKLARFASASFDAAQGEIRRFRTDQQAREVAEAEAALAAIEPRFAMTRTAASAGLDEICKAMPAGSVLVHVRRHDTGTPAYVAHVVAAGTCAISRIDLGPALDVDGDVRAYRQAAIAKDENAFGAAAKQVAKRIWTPLGAKVAAAKTVFVVPDGSIGGVSFAALPAGSGYLVERHSFVYLDAPGDVLRWKQSGAATGTAQVYGGIDRDFDLVHATLPSTIQTTHAAQSCGGFAIAPVERSARRGRARRARRDRAEARSEGAARVLRPARRRYRWLSCSDRGRRRSLRPDGPRLDGRTEPLPVGRRRVERLRRGRAQPAWQRGRNLDRRRDRADGSPSRANHRRRRRRRRARGGRRTRDVRGDRTQRLARRRARALARRDAGMDRVARHVRHARGGAPPGAARCDEEVGRLPLVVGRLGHRRRLALSRRRRSNATACRSVGRGIGPREALVHRALPLLVLLEVLLRERRDVHRLPVHDLVGDSLLLELRLDARPRTRHRTTSCPAAGRHHLREVRAPAPQRASSGRCRSSRTRRVRSTAACSPSATPPARGDPTCGRSSTSRSRPRRGSTCPFAASSTRSNIVWAANPAASFCTRLGMIMKLVPPL